MGRSQKANAGQVQTPAHLQEWQWRDATSNQFKQLCGPLNEHLRQIETALSVQIVQRGTTLQCLGKKADVQRTLAVLQALAEQIQTHPKHHLALDAVQLVLVEYTATSRLAANQAQQPNASHPQAGSEGVPLLTRKTDLRARTPRQQQYLDAIRQHDVTFGIGPAGTGKTYLAVACAVDALERDTVQRIVLTRPAVEAGERLGFLPGDLAQKVDPYLRPLYDALYDLLGFDKTTKLFERQAIEIAPLAYMRGRTLNHAFIILDEAQNTTPEQMKMFLTRIGFGSKAVVTGDPTQVDLPRGQTSGLIQAQTILQNIRGIAFTEFTSQDVVRHPLVARIVDAYAAAQKKD